MVSIIDEADVRRIFNTFGGGGGGVGAPTMPPKGTFIRVLIGQLRIWFNETHNNSTRTTLFWCDLNRRSLTDAAKPTKLG